MPERDVDLQLCKTASPDGLPTEGLAERKLDGVRAYTRDGRLYTRNGNDVTAQFPEIDPPEHHVLDGEVITGDFSFESALRRVQTEDGFKIDLLADRFPAVLVVFDALAVNGSDVRDRPLHERKELLGPSIPDDRGLVEISTHTDPAGLWQQATTEAWEGIVVKDPASPYRGTRSDDWQKVKHWNEDTFPVVGYEHTDNDGFVVYVDIGADDPQKVVVNGEDAQAAVRTGADAAEIQYLERTPSDRLRKPSFKGVA